MTTSTIHSRALLVSLSISTWTARKFDKKVTDQVNREHAASRDAGRYNKMLLPGDAAPYKTLLKVANKARQDHYANTLPWDNDGARILPTANYMAYTETMRGHALAFDAALAEFVAAYPGLREQARKLLNGMYRDADYPSPREIGRRFRYSIDFSPLPKEGDFRVELPSDEIAAIERQVTDRVERATADAMRDAWTRLDACVGKMNERLSDEDAIFRNSLVGNLRDLVDVLSRLNVTGDADLEAMRRRVEKELTTVEPDTLREDAKVRADIAQKAAEIQKDMAAFFGESK